MISSIKNWYKEALIARSILTVMYVLCLFNVIVGAYLSAMYLFQISFLSTSLVFTQLKKEKFRTLLIESSELLVKSAFDLKKAEQQNTFLRKELESVYPELKPRERTRFKELPEEP